MKRTYFITATDTDAGKTWVTLQLIQTLLQQGVRAKAVKPLACGVREDGTNEDVASLLQAQSIYHADDLNFLTLPQPAAPSIAADSAGTTIDTTALVNWCKQASQNSDITLVEGIGGLMVPITCRYLVSDWLNAMPEAAVILVVGAKLGCINHALLSLHLLASQQRHPALLILNDPTGTQDLTTLAKTISPHLHPSTELLSCGYHNSDALKRWSVSLPLIETSFPFTV